MKTTRGSGDTETQRLRERLAEAEARLAEAEETLRAIRGGEVDALVVAGPEGDQIFTLQGAETTYRYMIEEMNEGALMLGSEGQVLYANARFAQLAGVTLEEAIGASWESFFVPAERARLKELLPAARKACLREEFHLQAQGGPLRPVGVSLCPMEREGVNRFCAVVNDLTEVKEAQARLKAVSAYNRSLIEGSLDPLVTIGPDGRITDVNEATELATGCSRAALIGADFSDYFTEPEKARAGYQQVFREGFVRDYPLDLRHRDGRLMSVLYNACVYRDDAGEVIGVFAAARDITARKRAEEALKEANETLERGVAERTAELRQSEQRQRERALELQTILDTAPIGLAIASDAQGHHIRGNRANEEIFGLRPGAEFSKAGPRAASFRIFQDGRELGALELPMQRAIRGEVVREQVFEVVPEDGRRLTVFARATPLSDEAGHPRGAVGAFLDITAWKRAEEKLRESEERLQLALGASSAGVWSWDPTRQESTWDDRYHALYGLGPEDPRGFATWIALVHPEDQPRIKARLEEMLHTPGDDLWSVEFRALHPTLGERWHHGLGRAERDESGRIRRMTGIDLDISERKRAEERLRESEERLQLTLQASEVGTFEVDLCTGVGRWNAVEYELLGLKPGDAPAGPETFFRYVHPEDVAELKARWEEATRTGRFDSEFRVVWADGQHRWLAGKGQFFAETADGGAAGTGSGLRFLGVNFDITKRKLAEGALRQRSEELQTVLDTTPVAVFMAHDPECRKITGNPAAQEFVELPPEANISKSAPAEQRPTQWQEMRNGVPIEPEGLPLQRAVRGEEVRDYEMDMVFRGGKVKSVVGNATPIMDESGKPRGGVAVLMDITKRRQAEQALQESERRFRTMADGAPVLIWVNGPGGCEFANRAYLEFLGVDSHAEVQRFDWAEYVHPEDRAGYVKAYQECFQRQGRFEAVFRFRRRDGVYRWMQSSGSPRLGGSGEFLGYVGCTSDISEQKEFQAELQRLVDERTAKLHELVGELEHFSYTITHDLKSPLRAMRGFAEMMAATCAECEGPQAKEFLGRISKAAERMDHLIADALNFSRTVRQELPLEDVDAGALLRGMLDSYPELQTERARIQVEGPLPVVLANEAGLTQVFSNLLGNAVKFVKPGEKPDIKVWAIPREGWVRIWVEDKGIGIAKEMLPRVFDMFARGSKDYEGTGIGLALVRKVVQRMGGKVGVESQEGKGSRFWIDLRCGEAKANASQSAASMGAGAMVGTVLYVEDESSDALFMERAFEGKGLAERVRLVGDGRAAIEYLSGAGKYVDRERYPVPALVLLDLNLPHVPGFGVLEWMRNHPDYARTPVVVFSSSTREEDRARAQELGANDFVSKPSSGLRFGEVVERLQGKWLGRRRG